MYRSDAILVVEDDVDDMELIRYSFRKAAVADPLSFVDDGEKAVAYLAEDPPYDDRAAYPFPVLILLDLELPKLSVSEVLEWIRSNEETRRVPVVVLTSSDQKDDIRRVYGLGGNSHLAKPVRRDALQETVRYLDQYWSKLDRTVSA